MTRFVGITVVALVVAACSAGAETDDTTPDLAPSSTEATSTTVPTSTASATSTTTATTTATTVITPTSAAQVTVTPPQLADVLLRDVTLDGVTWRVAVADTPSLRSTGLMFVEDLFDLDGMVFVWPDDTTSTFWMKDTVIALDIAFFDADGAMLDVLSMVPCEVEDCPSYGIERPYRFALEARPGAFDDFSDGTLLVVS